MQYPIRKLQLKPTDLLLLMGKNPNEIFEIYNGQGTVVFHAHLNECVNKTGVGSVNSITSQPDKQTRVAELKALFDVRHVNNTDTEVVNDLLLCDKCRQPRDKIRPIWEDGNQYQVCSLCFTGGKKK